MALIKGITVTLYETVETGKDGFNHSTYDTKPIQVSNVLVAPTSASDIPTSTKADRRKAAYQLAIPKGDNHNWDNAVVEFFGHEWHTVGIPIEGIEANIPLEWNKKVTVERYE